MSEYDYEAFEGYGADEPVEEPRYGEVYYDEAPEPVLSFEDGVAMAQQLVQQELQPLRDEHAQWAAERDAREAHAAGERALDELQVPDEHRASVMEVAERTYAELLANGVAERYGVTPEYAAQVLREKPGAFDAAVQEILGANAQAFAAQVLAHAANAYVWENGGREAYYAAGGTAAGAVLQPGERFDSLIGADYGRDGGTVTSRFFGGGTERAQQLNSIAMDRYRARGLGGPSTWEGVRAIEREHGDPARRGR